jgi:hypothetical protein
MDNTKTKTVFSITKIAKILIVLFATIFLYSSFPVHTVHGTSFTNFPVDHAAFLSSSSYDAVFRSSITSASPSTVASSAVTVGPNVRVNGPQFPAPNGLLGRAETTIAVGQGGSRMVAGWNHADGFLREPFNTNDPLPGNPGLSGYAFSTNGGASWTDAGTPDLFPAKTKFFSGEVVTRGDPWLAVGKVNGVETFYYANLAVFKDRDVNNNIVDAGVSVHRGTFTGSGFTWNDGHVLPAPNAPFDFYDKEAIAVREVNGKTIVVVSVTNFIGISTPGTNPADCQFAGGFGQIEVWRSNDGGNIFQGPVIVQADETDTASDPTCSTGVLNQGSVPTIGPNGEVYVAWTRGPTFLNGAIVQPVSEQIREATSLDGGTTFSAPVVVRSIVPGRQNPPVGFNRPRYNDFPRIAVSDQGRVFIALQDAVAAGNAGIGGSETVCLTASGPPSPGPPCPDPTQRRVMVGGGADTDIYLDSSNDNGATWTSTLINPVARDGKIQFWPVVNIGGNGEVNVVYYESREEHVSSNPLAIDCSVSIVSGASPIVRRSLRASLVDTYFVQSLDGGKTFQTPVKVSTVTSNWCQGTVNIRPNFGDYIDARTVDNVTFAVWADDRNTILIDNQPRNIVDVFYSSISTN